MSVNKTSAARSVTWSLIENGGLAAISVVSLIVFARILSPSDFGVFSIVLSITEILTLIITMTFHDALIQRPDVTSRHFNTAYTASIFASLVLVAGYLATANLLERVTHKPGVAAIFDLMALTFPAAAFTSTIVAEQRRSLQFRSLAIRSIAGRVVGLVAGLVAAFLGAGLWSLPIQQSTMVIVASLVLWISAKSRPRLEFHSREFWQLVHFGKFAITNLFASFATKRIFTVLAGITLGAASAGYLNVAFRLIDVLWAIFATALQQVFLPILSRLQAHPEKVRSAYRTSVELTCLAVYPCFAGIGMVAPYVIELLFGAKWLPSAPNTTALALLVAFQAPRLFGTPLLTAIGKPVYGLPSVAVGAPAILLLGLLLPMNSLTNVMAVWILAELIAAVVGTAMVWRGVGIGPFEQYRGAATPFFATIVMCLVILAIRLKGWMTFTPLINVAILGVVGVVTYCAAMLLFDRKMLRRALGFGYLAVGKSQPSV